MFIGTFNEILNYLEEVIRGSKYEGHVFAVGGCCRDYKKNREIKDIDLVVDLPNGGIEFAKWLFESDLLMYEPVVYEHFGTAMFHLREFSDIELEAVQTRKESYRDIETRNPETAFGTIMDDCTRRDFTYNAIYYNISGKEFCDYNGNSFKDLEDNILRTCGEPDVIFHEDPLRILRAVRFMSRFGSTIEKETFEGMKRNVDRLSIISRERIHDEFMKMCEHYSPTKIMDAFFVLWDIGAFKYIIPYLGTFGHKDVYYFTKGIYEFMGKFGKKNISMEWLFATMLYNDPDVEQELRDLKCCNDFIDEVLFLIRTNKEYDEAFGKCIEDGDFEPTFLFRKYAHICGSRSRMMAMLSCGGVLSDYFFDWDEEDGYFFDVLSLTEHKFYEYELPVDGGDVMEVFGIGPSKKVGDTLKKLWNFVFVNPDKCGREDVMNFLKYLKNENGNN